SIAWPARSNSRRARVPSPAPPPATTSEASFTRRNWVRCVRPDKTGCQSNRPLTLGSPWATLAAIGAPPRAAQSHSGASPPTSLVQAIAARMSSSHASNVASPKSPALSPHPRRSISSTPKPCAARRRDASATIGRHLFISSANAGTWTMRARSPPSEGARQMQRRSLPPTASWNGSARGGTLRPALAANELHEAANGRERRAIDLVVLDLEPEAILERGQHADHRHRVELGHGPQQRRRIREARRAALEAEHVVENCECVVPGIHRRPQAPIVVCR